MEEERVNERDAEKRTTAVKLQFLKRDKREKLSFFLRLRPSSYRMRNSYLLFLQISTEIKIDCLISLIIFVCIVVFCLSLSHNQRHTDQKHKSNFTMQSNQILYSVPR